MAERGSRTPASARTAAENLGIMEQQGTPVRMQDYSTTAKLRQELATKGLQGFKRGGKVKKTGVYKLHKGEKVITAKAARAKPKGRR